MMRKYNDVYYRPAAMNMVEEDGKAWMALINRNGICEVDMATRQARICKIFEGEPLGKELLYCHAAKVGKELIFAPGMADKIAIYDLGSEKLTYIPLRNMESVYRERPGEAKFWNIIQHQSCAYLLGYSYPAIVKVDMDTKEISYITDWAQEVEKDIETDDFYGYLTDGHVIYEDMVLIPVGCMKAVLELDLKTDRTELKKIETTMEGIGGISSADGENIWMVGRGGGSNRIVYWNRKIGNIKEILLTDLKEAAGDPFYAPLCTKDKVFLTPISASSIYELDIETKKISNVLDEKGKKKNDPLWPCWVTMASRLKNGWVKFITCQDLMWHEYQVATGTKKDYFVHMHSDIKEREDLFCEICIQSEKTNVYEKEVDLRYFINTAVQGNEKKLYETKFNGKRIYGRMK